MTRSGCWLVTARDWQQLARTVYAFIRHPPLLPDFSHLARRQVTLWADERRGRMAVARRMYALRLGEVLPHRDIAVLRGIEGARVKEMYKLTAARFGIEWRGRHYDRQAPHAADLPNQGINHAASAAEGAAAIAVAATATIPQLGFVHEDSGQSFILDIADLFRDTLTIPCAFKAAAAAAKRPGDGIERLTRRIVGERLRRDAVIPAMIDRIKTQGRRMRSLWLLGPLGNGALRFGKGRSSQHG